ncbi:MAG: aminotransferase class V-fold PLP-dependent enzyme [Actinomycetota bacterium]
MAADESGPPRTDRQPGLVAGSPLSVDLETMRQMGYRTIDLLVDRAAAEREAPTLRTASREEMEARVPAEPSAQGIPFDDILDRLATDVLPFAARWDHPRFFGYIPGSGTWPGVLGDLVASACNFDTGSWRESAGPSQVELTVLDWFKDWIGYPAEASGVLVSGGSAANMTALACAREARLGPMSERAVAYMSDQAHSSMARAARILGFRPEQVRILPSDERSRLSPDVLRRAMDADTRAGLTPLFVAAAAGSTSTGAVDPLEELAGTCEERGVWLHVDAAYGGFAVLTERGSEWLRGLGLADSVTLDPHKWLYQPFEVGCLLVRDGPLLRRAFEITPDYLKDMLVVGREVSFANYGMQLSRMARALKVWVSISYFGVDAFRSAIDRSIDLARMAEERIRSSERLELLAPASLGVVCFRRSFEGAGDDGVVERMNGEVVRRLVASGRGLVSSTRLRGRFALRMCVMNHTSTAEDVEEVLALIEDVRVEPPSGPAPAPADEREPGVRQAWLERRSADAIAGLGLFRDLDEEQRGRLREAAWETVVPPGSEIVQAWEFAREFYVILEGEVSVEVDGHEVASLGPGAFFGEVAALDWGAGYGYPRTASVTASSVTHLLVVPGSLLNELVRDAPAFGEIVRQAMALRLSGT